MATPQRVRERGVTQEKLSQSLRRKKPLTISRQGTKLQILRLKLPHIKLIKATIRHRVTKPITKMLTISTVPTLIYNRHSQCNSLRTMINQLTIRHSRLTTSSISSSSTIMPSSLTRASISSQFINLAISTRTKR